MDYLDIITGRFMQTYTGTYLEREPPAVQVRSQADAYEVVVPAYFDYEYINPDSASYRHLLQNLIEKGSYSATIKTATPLGYKIGAFVKLYNGRKYVIDGVVEDSRAASREAAGLLPIPAGTEYILTLIQVSDPRGG